MNSLPPQARVSDVPDFLDRDEAESLTEALLSLVEEDPPLADEGESEPVRLGVGEGEAAELPNGQDGLSDVSADKQGAGSDKISDDHDAEVDGETTTNVYGFEPSEPVDLLDDLFDGPEDDTEALEDRDSLLKISKTGANADTDSDDADSDDIDEVHKALQEALASPRSEDSETGGTPTEERTESETDTAGDETVDQAPTEETPEFGRPVTDPGLLFFSRPTPPGADDQTPDDVYVFDGLEAVDGPTTDTDVEGQEDTPVEEKNDVRNEETETHTSSETVAGSGPSEETSSETIAESGNRSLFSEAPDDKRTVERRARGVRVMAGMPRQRVESRTCEPTVGLLTEPEKRKSFSWFCSERVTSNSREGFGIEETDEAPSTRTKVVQTDEHRQESGMSDHKPDSFDLLEDNINSVPSSRWSAPFLASSDIAGIQTFRTKGARIKHLRLLASRGQAETSPPVSESDGVNGSASLLSNRSLAEIRQDKSSVILAGMMAIGFVVFTWLLYLYLVKDPGLSSTSGIEGALLLGPTAFRLRRRFSLRSRLKLATMTTDAASAFIATGVKSEREGHGHRGLGVSSQQEHFVVHSVGTRDFYPRAEASVAVYVVDLPKLRCDERSSDVSSVEPSASARCRSHRAGRPSPRQSVVNRRSRAF